MTNEKIEELLNKIQTLAAEDCEAFVFIGYYQDENGKRFTIRRVIGGDSAVIGMMEIFKFDLLKGHYTDSNSE